MGKDFLCIKTQISQLSPLVVRLPLRNITSSSDHVEVKRDRRNRGQGRGKPSLCWWFHGLALQKQSHPCSNQEHKWGRGRSGTKADVSDATLGCGGSEGKMVSATAMAGHTTATGTMAASTALWATATQGTELLCYSSGFYQSRE